MAAVPALPGAKQRSTSEMCFCSGKKGPSRASTAVCGVSLFALGLVSLLAGQIAADIEWSQLRQRWRVKKVKNNAPIDIWGSKYANLYHGCSSRGPNFRSVVPENESNGYLLIATSGGLNQQRIGIADAVVVAWIMNATLVVPQLDHHSYWKDNSEFADIFDVDWFISYLSKDVTVVKRIPDTVMRSMEKIPYTTRPPRKSTAEYYLDQALPILRRRHALQLTKFDYRLSNQLEEPLQKLRCRVNFHALKFTKSIHDLGRKLVQTLRNMSPRYVAIHLRFEPDMLAFTGCYYGGGEKERNELGEIRKRWATLPDLNEDDERSRGKCPLTPHEVGFLLKALGFGNETLLYIASGEIYGGEETLRPLRDLFPNLYTKESLARTELEPFLSFSSRLAAIDFIVCDESDAFVANNNGNMAKILAGRRRYIGHKRTIRPNGKKLSSLLRKRSQLDWDTFATKVRKFHRGFMGEPNDMTPGRGDFHEFPYSCICKRNKSELAALTDKELLV